MSISSSSSFVSAISFFFYESEMSLSKNLTFDLFSLIIGVSDSSYSLDKELLDLPFSISTVLFYYFSSFDSSTSSIS